MKFKYRNREFWYRGFNVDTVVKNAKKITEYIQNQLKEDENPPVHHWWIFTFYLVELTSCFLFNLNVLTKSVKAPSIGKIINTTQIVNNCFVISKSLNL